ncbi:MAG: hypothetical protein RBT45_05660 [Acholeplasmataceae bacterium]|nr:hypothetical protein [Acholeplasmataceae bacterium]
METKIDEQEKNTLIRFIDCKIPLLVKDNLYNYKHDLMQCYEEMFNYAHSLINGYMVRSKEIYCVFDDDFTHLLITLEKDGKIKEFSSLAIEVIQIMKNINVNFGY